MSKVFISKELSKDLALRDNAIRFFANIDKDEQKEVIIDFSDADTITRSFADEYIKRKKQSKKEIIEKNIPINISKMFEIVERVNQLPHTKSIN